MTFLPVLRPPIWILAAGFVLAVTSGCSDVHIVTSSYGTLDEAIADSAVEQGRLPGGLPPGTRDIREAHDPQSARRWGLFEFPPAEREHLQALLGSEMSFEGQRVSPPRRIEWWPVLLRGDLNEVKLTATGLRAYQARSGDLMFAVNWNQGRAYYWTVEMPKLPKLP